MGCCESKSPAPPKGGKPAGAANVPKADKPAASPTPSPAKPAQQAAPSAPVKEAPPAEQSKPADVKAEAASSPPPATTTVFVSGEQVKEEADKKEEPAAPAPEPVEEKKEPEVPPEAEAIPEVVEPEEPKAPKSKKRTRTLDLEAVKDMMDSNVSRYELQGSLGKGAYGVVVAAHDKQTKERVAVKKVSKDLLAKEGEAGEKRLYREVAIMGALNHPNLVNLKRLCFNESTNEMWLVLELVEGEELMKRIDRTEGLTEDEARNYFQQLIVGVHYLHSQNVAHRDLKPENILVTNTGGCKITDFGLSNIQNINTVGEAVNLKTCCGTPYYVAPEVVTRREGYSGFTADVWSLGIVLYVMLMNDLPFTTARDIQDLLQKIKKAEYKIPADKDAKLSSDVKDLIRRILDKDPTTRIKVEEIVQHPWFRPGFDDSLMDVEGIEVDEAAMDHMKRTIADWGQPEKEEEEKQVVLAPGAGDKNRALFAQYASGKK